MAFRAKRNDPRAKYTDAEFIERFSTLGPARMARDDKCDISAIYRRRRSLEKSYRKQIMAPALAATGGGPRTRHNIEHAARLHYDCLNGEVLIGSDAHIWPGPPTTAMRAFIKFAKDIQPRLLILNGDVVDLPQISRHPPIGWNKLPTVEEEINAAKQILAEIEDAVPGNTKLIWTLGNHCARFETRLATVAHEYASLHGFSLKDHFPSWSGCWAAWINQDVVVKHRFKGGVHAPHNNTINSGKHMVTGHLHSAKVSPWTDYNGTRYGVDTGCLADPDAEAFVDYTEDGPKNWVSAFAVLKFHKGKLLPPEHAIVWDKKHVVFRGQIIEV